jgi:hypothetical protein
MAQHRLIGVTVLAILGALGALVSAYHAHRHLGSLPLVSGPLPFRGQAWLGATLRAHCAAIPVGGTVVFRRVDRRGWFLAVMIPALHVILAGPSILGASAFRAGPPAAPPDGTVPPSSPVPGVEDAGVGSTIASHR